METKADGLRVVLIEDDVELGTTLADELRAFGHDVTWVADGRDGLQLIDREPFNAAILDRMLPQVDGTMVLRRLREAGHTLPVLMLSALGLSAEKVEGLNAGADDYVVKPTPASEIDARLSAMVRARSWTAGPGDTLRAGDVTVSPTQFRAWRAGRDLALGHMEFKMLAVLARNAGAVVTRAMFLEQVWGYDFEPAANIVDVHIRCLRRRLTATGGDDPIVTMRGVGYMLRA